MTSSRCPATELVTDTLLSPKGVPGAPLTAPIPAAGGVLMMYAWANSVARVIPTTKSIARLCWRYLSQANHTAAATDVMAYPARTAVSTETRASVEGPG